jgi:DNA-directed RNA polymerase subunit M/transcription elongation factor TFIIS
MISIEKYLGLYQDSVIKEFWRMYIHDRKRPGDPRLPMEIEEEESKRAWMLEWQQNKKPDPPQASDTFGIQGYECIKCHQHNVKMMTVQTRSLDERSCQLFQCLNTKCNATWKQ